MPGYPGTAQAKLLRNNQQAFFFNRELVAAGVQSAAFQLERINRSFYPFGASFEIFFTDANGNPANPGACEIDIMTADIDQANHYCPISSVVLASLNANFVGRIELPNFWAKYVCALVKTLTNSVYTSVLVTR